MESQVVVQSKEAVLDWLERSVGESKAFDDDKSDFEVSVAKEIAFDPQGPLVVKAVWEGQNASVSCPLVPTDHAWHQMYQKLGPTVWGPGSRRSLPADYLKAIGPELRAYLMNAHVQQHEGRWLVRSYQAYARAVLGSRYPVIWNTNILKQLHTAIAETKQDYPNMRVVRSWVDPDGFAIRIVWRDVRQSEGPDGNGNGGSGYGVGVYVAHDEVGKGAIRIYPLVQRSTCENSIIIAPHVRGGQSEEDEDSDMFRGLRLVHQGSDFALRQLIAAGLTQALSATGEVLDKLLQADARALPDIDAVLLGMAKTYGWSEETKLDVARGTEGKDSVLGVINGVTFAAKHEEGEDAMLAMESLGGELITLPDRWFRQMELVGTKVRAKEADRWQL